MDSVHYLVGGVGQAMDWSSQDQSQVTMAGELYGKHRVGPRVQEMLGDGTSNMRLLIRRNTVSGLR